MNEVPKWVVRKIYQERNKYIAKYLAIYNENSHLKKSMVSLSSKLNTYEDTVKLRNLFIKRLNRIKYTKNKNYELGYFSAIEVDSSKNNEDQQFRNWHVHIQLHTNIPKKKIEEILNKLPTDMCQYSNLTTPKSKNKDIKFDYVIKDLKKVNIDLFRFMKNNHPKKSLYSMSRKSVSDYVYKAISKYMNENNKKEWTKTKDKYGTILNWVENKDIIFEDTNIKDEDMNYIIDNYTLFNSISAKTKHIAIKKDIWSKS